MVRRLAALLVGHSGKERKAWLRQVRVWDLGSSKCSHEFVVENGVPVRCVALTNDGQVGRRTAQRVLSLRRAAERSDRRSARASWLRSGSACVCLVRRPDRRCFSHSRNSPLLQRLFVGTNTGLIHVFAWPSSAEATKLSEFQVGSLNMRRRWSKCATANMPTCDNVMQHAT